MNRKTLHFLARFRHAFKHLRGRHHKQVARAAVASHLAYYALVFDEAHGKYGYAAGVCGVILLIETIVGGPKE